MDAGFLIGTVFGVLVTVGLYELAGMHRKGRR